MTKAIQGIYGILPADLPLEELLAKAEAALIGGVETLQLRDKGVELGERFSRAEALRAMTRLYHARLIINDDTGLAMACSADGLHVGPEDTHDLKALRAELGSEYLLGVSCKGSIDAARHALENEADYVSFGAIFPTTSKAEAVVCGVDILRQARAALPEANIVAIGGMTAERLPEVRTAGADAAAIIGGLFGDENVKSHGKRLIEAWNGESPSA